MSWSIGRFHGSFQTALIFWWIALLLAQQAERLFLLPETLSREAPSVSVLAMALLTGLQADAITTSVGILVALAVATVLEGIWRVIQWRDDVSPTLRRAQVQALLRMAAYGMMALLFMILLTADMGYYHYNQQHLNFVFFEYVADLMAQTAQTGLGTAQAAQQTTAELTGGNWAPRVLGFLLAQSVVIGGWWLYFRHRLEPILLRWKQASPIALNVLLGLWLVSTTMGIDFKGPYGIRIANINSAAYYTLAQNPLLYTGEAIRAALDSRLRADSMVMNVPLKEALRVAQEALAPAEAFPYSEYPLVHFHHPEMPAMRLSHPANVLVIIIEALDRRYLGTKVMPAGEGFPAGIRLTSFLDRLRQESLYFEHFFSNGVQTARGLFSTFCSYFPRQGSSAMKTLYTHDYLCLPAILQRAGYQTEMVVSQHRDLNRLQLFMARNGLDRLLGEQDFPANVERAAGRITDAALFGLVHERLNALQQQGRPFFLVTQTHATHHPFSFRSMDPEVQALRSDPDGYLAALRYTDLELERLFGSLKAEGLLKNTVVLLLGDHGRHEQVGDTDLARQAGHFTTPLLIWLDESLRTPETYRPRTVSVVASQVDVAPTILAMNGLAPRLSPFLGRDLSCLLAIDCVADYFAFLSSVYDDLIGLAQGDQILFYSLRTERLLQSTLDLTQPTSKSPDDPTVAPRYRRLLSLYATSNAVLERNAVWSWTELGPKL
jgi:phosphoglycerol transferase MdoB-like AlkP superfamily enzyme